MATTLADEQEYVKVLYWGDYGTGKTTDMAYMAHSGTVKWLRADKGLKPGPLRQLGVPVKNIEPIDELRPEALEHYLEDYRGALEDKPGSLAGIVLDTATELISRRIEVQVDNAWRDYLNRCRKNHVEPDQALRYMAYDNVRDLYLPVSQELNRMVRHMTDLPWHVAISAQLRRDVDENSGRVTYGPAANPAIASTLIGYCDLVIETENQGYWHDNPSEECFVGHPRPRDGRQGKDRFHALPRFLCTPTFDRVLAYVRGDLDFKTDPVQLRYRDELAARAKDNELP